ncbi:hypothetical protein J5N97_023731 [Dioscorea zingiberensis]|uniref:Leucine-rich repeat-containing N-terminal plant-type domain-containing protein n=1 Tax=Dioscorea zingiberensis TaxID=325984 RepID=A0A9D5H846_9LILI|nr:hypothetical protein J5N97_023731 [Dioscorea zingiberensis]
MEARNIRYSFILFFIHLHCLCPTFSFHYSQSHGFNSHNLSCNSNDLKSLITFTEGLDDSMVLQWPLEGVHNSSSCCNWEGITCNTSSSGLKNIVGLNLSMKGLRGELLIDLQGFDQLKYLNLSFNSFTSTIPLNLFLLPSLEVIDLRNNLFSGELPTKLGALSTATHIDLSFNLITGAIPNVFRGLSKLRRFIVQSNNLVGCLPSSLSLCSSLQFLDLNNNSLGGRLSSINFRRLVLIEDINLSSNKLHGIIPESLSSCRSLKTLQLAKNYLYGNVPASFRHLQALAYVSLSGNNLSNLSNTLQTFQECQNLKVLILTNNFNGETMDSNGVLLGFKRLKVVVIASSALSGHIPSWLSSSKELRLIDLSWNQLSGTLPLWLGTEMEYLFYLDLSNNSINGEIPETFAKFKSLTSITYLNESDDTSYIFPLITKRNGTVKEYNKYMSLPPLISLSNNLLNGLIPRELGKLKMLHVLDLSYNKFSGPIPDELSGMKSLEKMDLSHNDLSGGLPSSLVELTFLSSFSVAYNHLEGMIPSGGQFFSFPSSSFEGNIGLCGEFVFPCNNLTGHVSHEPLSNESGVGGDDDDDDDSLIGLPFFLGIIFGLFLSVLILTFQK